LRAASAVCFALSVAAFIWFVIPAMCRATIKVRKPDNQDEKVVALLVS
jgi:hypothetical protein